MVIRYRSILPSEHGAFTTILSGLRIVFSFFLIFFFQFPLWVKILYVTGGSLFSNFYTNDCNSFYLLHTISILDLISSVMYLFHVRPSFVILSNFEAYFRTYLVLTWHMIYPLDKRNTKKLKNKNKTSWFFLNTCIYVRFFQKKPE